MKKWGLALFLSVVLAFSMAGCGNKEEASEKEEQKVAAKESVSLTLWGGEDDQAMLESMINDFIAAYGQEANFEITFAPQSESGCKDALLADVEAGADVFTFADDQLMTMVAAGVLEPVADSGSVKEANLEAAVDAASVGDTLYAYPMTADNGYFLYYNKAYFGASDVATLDKILEICDEQGKQFAMDWSSGWYTYAFFGLSGMEIGLNEDGVTNYCNWNRTDGNIKGADVARAMLAIAEHSGFANTTDEQLVEGIVNGNVIAAVSGTWNSPVIQKTWGKNMAATKLPTYTCKESQLQMASFAGYKMVGVNAYSEHKEWALKLADWITNEDNQVKRFVERGQGPSNINAADSEEMQNSIGIQGILEQSEFASLQRVGVNFWDPTTEFGTAMAGHSNADIQEMLDKMVKDITAPVAY